MVDISAVQMLLLTVTSWLDRREREVLAYLILRESGLAAAAGWRRLRLTDDDVLRALSIGPSDVAPGPDDRHAGHVAPLAPAAHRPQMDVRQAGQDSSRCCGEIRQLVRRMAEETPRWGCTRIPGALKNSGTA